jgi:hypothetical protein
LEEDSLGVLRIVVGGCPTRGSCDTMCLTRKRWEPGNAWGNGAIELQPVTPVPEPI